MELKTFAVAIQSNFVKEVTLKWEDSTHIHYSKLEDVTPVIVATTYGISQEEVIEKVSLNYQIPKHLLVAFELAI